MHLITSDIIRFNQLKKGLLLKIYDIHGKLKGFDAGVQTIDLWFIAYRLNFDVSLGNNICYMTERTFKLLLPFITKGPLSIILMGCPEGYIDVLLERKYPTLIYCEDESVITPVSKPFLDIISYRLNLECTRILYLFRRALTSKVILVEGVTDYMFYRKFIKDIPIVYCNGIVNVLALNRVLKHSFAIVDNDFRLKTCNGYLLYVRPDNDITYLMSISDEERLFVLPKHRKDIESFFTINSKEQIKTNLLNNNLKHFSGSVINIEIISQIRQRLY